MTDMIDLISEKHGALRHECERLWSGNGSIPVSTSEWYVLSRIHGRAPTVSEVTRRVDISRQGVHKRLNSLEEKGIVRFFYLDNNKRDKYVSLTEFGNACYAQYTALKQALQDRICAHIGAESMELVLELLQKDWLG